MHINTITQYKKGGTHMQTTGNKAAYLTRKLHK